MALTGLTKVQKIGINSTTIPTFGGSRNTGVVTATTFVGDGSGLSNVTGSGSGVIVRDGGSLVGTAGTINFGTNLNVSAISAGIVTVTNAVSASALNNLSDVTISSASNGQILKHNGSVFVNVAETDTTYSQSSVASGSNVNLRLTDSGGTNDDILITAGSNITFSSISAGGFTIAASGGGGGGGLSNVVEDTTPQLGGSLDLNNKFITGSGGINVSGVVTATTFSGSFTGDVTGAASQITVADESSDTTGFVVFTNTASGNNAPKTGSNLTFDSADGVLGATKFTGSGVALTGVVTSIVAGSNITLTGGPTGIVTIAAAGGGSGITDVIQDTTPQLGGNLDLNSKNITGTGSFNVTGIITATYFTASESGVTGQYKRNQIIWDRNSYNYIDCSNDSGQFAIRMGSSQTTAFAVDTSADVVFSNNRKIKMGSGTPLQLYHNGSNSIIKNTTGDLEIRGSVVKILGETGSEASVFTRSGSVDLMFNGVEKLATDNGGVKITGVCTATSFSGNLTGTASTATRVTVTDQSTDTTCNVLFTQGATGNQLPHTGTNLTFNSSSGALTAGSFVKSGGSSSQFLKADGSVDGSTYLTSGSYLENVVEDTTPQLGGNLDLNSKNITGTGEIRVVGLITATSAVKTWTLGASGSSHYTFTGDGFTSATNDPDIYLERGKRYAFLNNAGGTSHPFQIRVSNGGSAYTTGVTYHTEHQSGSNSASQGYITFNVPWDAPASLYYQCTAHSSMGGNIYIRGGSGGETNVGVITATTFVPTVGQLSHRNLIINGAMTVTQRGQVDSVTDGFGGPDRFRFQSNYSAVTMSQSTDVPTGQGFIKSLKMDVTTAGGDSNASTYTQLDYRFEGQELARLKYGTSSAETMTLCFWIKSPKSGTHWVRLYGDELSYSGGSGNAFISRKYYVNSANTWQKVTLNFPGYTTDGFDNNETVGMRISWYFAQGSAYSSGTAQADDGGWLNWGSASDRARNSVGQVNCFDSTSNDIFLTGVQFEVGAVTTPFEFRSFGDELANCQRYFIKDTMIREGSGYGVVTGALDSIVGIQVDFPVTMRNSPSLSLLGTTYRTGGSADAQRISKTGFIWGRKQTGSGTFNGAAYATGGYQVDAEL